jgi:hypothetical protein
MTRFLANWEVESDIILPQEIPFVRHEHPAGTYTVFLRNLPETRHDITFLSMQIVFEAPALSEAKDIAEPLAKGFLDYLTFASNLRTRLRDLWHIFNWEPGNDGHRECYYYTPRDAYDGSPYEALDHPRQSARTPCRSSEYTKTAMGISTAPVLARAAMAWGLTVGRRA